MSATVTAFSTVTCPSLGQPIPLSLPHAISVSLPTWKDNVGYEEGEKRVWDAMRTGYPRFFVHKSIEKLAALCQSKFGHSGERCMLFAKAYIAVQCRNFILASINDPNSDSPTPVRLAQWSIRTPGISSTTEKEITLHIVLFPGDTYPISKQFWQHTGLGISSRLAERCLSSLGEEEMLPDPTGLSASPPKAVFPCKNRHYASKTGTSRGFSTLRTTHTPVQENDVWNDQGAYLEERYGRNLPENWAEIAKRKLRRRIAGALAHDRPRYEQEVRPSTCGVEEVTEDDVYLYPTGMGAIWSAHQLCLASLPPAKSICFGFPYTDTLKILQKWGPGCHFFGNGTDEDIDALEKLLLALEEPKTLALICEFPSNPLLRSANLPRLRALADKYHFPIIIDVTVGNFVNVDVLPYADILVNSMSKVFSGETNVMGGSLILNPKGRFYHALKTKLQDLYEDSYWDEDGIYMERNSRDFVKRIWIINRNTEVICDFLHDQIGSAEPVVKSVYYPKWETRTNYDVCRLPVPEGQDCGNFGGLFSVCFNSEKAAHTFFDALPCAKGPSLGTNFTLACPYTILAHFTELNWAAEYGVDKNLIRISVGMEDQEVLLSWFRIALKAAKDAVLNSS